MSGSLLSINTNLGAMAALETLNATQQSLNTTQNAVSTGLSVSQASDNPAIYAIGQTMQANISALTAVQNNLSFGQSTVGVAANAGAQISSQLATLQQTVTQADQAGISPTTMQQQVNSLLTNINQFATSANFNGVNLLDGATTNQLNVVQDTAGNSIALTNQNATTTGLGLSGLTVTGSNLTFNGIAGGNQLTTGVTATGTATTAYDNFSFTAAGEVNSAGTSTGAMTYNFVFVTAASNVANGSVNTSITGQTAAGVASGTVAASAGNVSYNVVVGNSQAATMTNLIQAIQGINGSIPGTTDALSSGAKAAPGQLFSAVLDSNGNMSIASASPDIVLSAGAYTPKTASSTDAAITAGSGTSAQQAILTVQNSVALMNTKLSNIGSAQQQITGLQNFNSQLSDSFTSGLGALTDANMAAESAQLQSLQTKQQLAIRSLSIANAQPQSLLNLFP